MRKNPMVAMLLTVFMLFAIVAPAMARTPEETLNDAQYLHDQINLLETAGQTSNNEVYSLWVDFSTLSNANVAMSVYKDGSTIPTNNTIFPLSKVFTWKDAEQQLVKFALGNIANRYRAEPLNTDITCITYFPDFSQRDSIPFYVYGQHKTEAIAELYSGIPTCFDIAYYPPNYDDDSSPSGFSGSMSKPITPIETPVADSIKEGTSGQVMSAIFAIGNTSITTSAGTVTMDVAPYVKDNRTYVPMRYLAEALGAEVVWDQTAQTVTLSKGDTIVIFTIGSTAYTVNSKSAVADVAPEIASDRTMLPARYVAEALGSEIKWDEVTQQVLIITPEIEPGD